MTDGRAAPHRNNLGQASLGQANLRRYNVLWAILRPVLWLVLLRRAARGKELRARLAERFGRYAPNADLPSSPIWIHAVSVGESVGAIALVEAIRKSGSQHDILITTNTVTAATRIAALDPQLGVRHLFQPLDHPQMVAAFLRRIKPRLAIFLESDFWPNLVIQTGDAGIPIAFASTQLSDRAFSRWQKRPALARQLFGTASLVLAVDDRQADRLIQLGAAPASVQHGGSLKLPLQSGQPDEGVVAKLRDAANGRRILLAASTHKGEDETVIDAARQLGSGWMTIIAPRHPERGSDIAALCQTAGMAAPRRAAGDTPDSTTQIYIADTLGEMDSLFAVADIVFLAGSLLPIGGHNPVEPAAYGKPILSGQHVFKNTAEFDALRRAGVVTDIHDATSMASAAQAIIDDPARTERIAKAACHHADAAGKRPEIAAELCLKLIAQNGQTE